MNAMAPVHCLGIAGRGQAYVHDYDEGPVPEGHVRLDTLYSGFSAGTELSFLRGTNPYLTRRWNEGLAQFEEKDTSESGYPVPFVGYMELGRVADGAAGFAPGQLLGGTWGHKSAHVADPGCDQLEPLPDAVDPILGIYLAQMGPIAANGVLHADVELLGAPPVRLGDGVAGRAVLVLGGGVVGILAALFAAAAGAEVVVGEPSAFRRQRIASLGLVAMQPADAVTHAKQRWHHGGGGRGADVVLQTRGHGESLALALRALRPQGAVIDLAFYQDGAAALCLGEEFHHNALSIRCAQIARTPRGTESRWDRGRLAEATGQLLRQRGAEMCTQLITHVVDIDDAPAFLRTLINERPEFLQIVWRFPAADG